MPKFSKKELNRLLTAEGQDPQDFAKGLESFEDAPKKLKYSLDSDFALRSVMKKAASNTSKKAALEILAAYVAKFGRDENFNKAKDAVGKTLLASGAKDAFDLDMMNLNVRSDISRSAATLREVSSHVAAPKDSSPEIEAAQKTLAALREQLAQHQKQERKPKRYPPQRVINSINRDISNNMEVDLGGLPQEEVANSYYNQFKSFGKAEQEVDAALVEPLSQLLLHAAKNGRLDIMTAYKDARGKDSFYLKAAEQYGARLSNLLGQVEGDIARGYSRMQGDRDVSKEHYRSIFEEVLLESVSPELLQRIEKLLAAAIKNERDDVVGAYQEAQGKPELLERAKQTAKLEKAEEQAAEQLEALKRAAYLQKMQQKTAEMERRNIEAETARKLAQKQKVDAIADKEYDSDFGQDEDAASVESDGSSNSRDATGAKVAAALAAARELLRSSRFANRGAGEVAPPYKGPRIYRRRDKDNKAPDSFVAPSKAVQPEPAFPEPPKMAWLAKSDEQKALQNFMKSGPKAPARPQTAKSRGPQDVDAAMRQNFGGGNAGAATRLAPLHRAPEVSLASSLRGSRGSLNQTAKSVHFEDEVSASTSNAKPLERPKTARGPAPRPPEGPPPSANVRRPFGMVAKPLAPANAPTASVGS